MKSDQVCCVEGAEGELNQGSLSFAGATFLKRLRAVL